MGDEVPLKLNDVTNNNILLKANLPSEGRIQLFRNGSIIKTDTSKSLEHSVSETGVYRVEVQLQHEGNWYPWIYSNPIYIVN